MPKGTKTHQSEVSSCETESPASQRATGGGGPGWGATGPFGGGGGCWGWGGVDATPLRHIRKEPRPGYSYTLERDSVASAPLSPYPNQKSSRRL